MWAVAVAAVNETQRMGLWGWGQFNERDSELLQQTWVWGHLSLSLKNLACHKDTDECWTIESIDYIFAQTGMFGQEIEIRCVEMKIK